jgi:hypothetical protein
MEIVSRHESASLRGPQHRVPQSRIGGLQQIKQLRIGRRMFEYPLDGSIDVKHREAMSNRPACRHSAKLF